MSKPKLRPSQEIPNHQYCRWSRDEDLTTRTLAKKKMASNVYLVFLKSYSKLDWVPKSKLLRITGHAFRPDALFVISIKA